MGGLRMPKKIENLHSPFFSTYILAGYDVMERPVPETSPTKYLSGMISLCLTSPWTDYSPGQNSGPDCLYCFKDYPEPLPVWGEGADPSRKTLQIYGDYGIHNCADILISFGFDHNYDIVYGADHYRAIVDIVFSEMFDCNVQAAIDIGFNTTWVIAESICDINKSMALLDKVAIMRPFFNKRESRITRFMD
jgi:hypothetical protein